MSERLGERLGPATGVLFVALLMGATTIESDHPAVLGAEVVALLLLLPFACFVSSVLREAEGDSGWLSATALVAVVAGVAVKLASIPPYVVAQSAGVAPEVQETMTALNNAAFMVTLLPYGVFMAAVAVVTLTRGGLPVWLGWLAAVAAPLLVANGMFLEAEFGPAFLLFLLWVLLAGVLLALRPGVVRQRRGEITPAP